MHPVTIVHPLRLQRDSVRSILLGLCIMLAGLAAQAWSPNSVRAQEKPTFEQRLEVLDSRLQLQLDKYHLPGFAIAIVKDGEVVFAKGYGYQNLETKKTVQPETLFAIGSTTKAVTGALIGMMVDDGKLDWDDPVDKYLPDFRMKVDTGGKKITIRDLLSHRTGYSRMGLLWAAGKTDWREVLERARTAEPFGKFRKDFIYNNVMFMTAGRSAGVAANSDWNTLTKERIFDPLGMKDSGTRFEFLDNDPRVSLGYLWDVDRNDFVPLPKQNLNAIGPAGSIVSNVNDMSKWLQFQLANGEFEGKQLLSKESHAETWKPQIKMAGNVHYGLGWMLRTWNGHPVVEHGGSISGYAAQVSLLPDHNAGYVMLTNVTATPFQQESIGLVFDTLFKQDQAGTAVASAKVDKSELIGNYNANFASFNNATLKVLMKGEHLALDVPGQQVFELKEPDSEGKWFFALTDQVAISFNRDEEGRVFSISMYQNGMKPEFIREGIELPPETPTELTAPLLGTYRMKDGSAELELVLRNGRLTVDAGNRAFVLAAPDEDGLWALRASPKRMQIRFNRNEDDSVRSLTRVRGERETEMMKVEVEDSIDTMDAETAIALAQMAFGNVEDLDFAAVRMTGNATFVHQGAQGSVALTFSRTGQHHTEMDFGKLAQIQEAYDGKMAAYHASISRYEELAGQRLKQAASRSPLWILGDWERHFDHASYLGEQQINGEKTLVVAFTDDVLPPRKIFIAAETGFIVREEGFHINEVVGKVPVEIVYSDFRDVDGIMLAHQSVTTNQLIGAFKVVYDSAKLLTEIPNGTFTITKPDEN